VTILLIANGLSPVVAIFWLVVMVLTQVIDSRVLRRYRDLSDARSLKERDLLRFQISVGVATTWFTLPPAALWFSGNSAMQSFSMIWYAGSVMHVLVHFSHVHRLAVFAAAPHMFFFFGLPFWAVIFAEPMSRFDGAAILAATAMFTVATRAVYRLFNESSYALQEAKSRALEEKSAAEAANTAKSGFLAIMSHELRTPLNGMLGMAHALSESKLNERQRSQISTIKDSGGALLSILNDILDLSKVEAGKLIIEEHDFNLREMITQLADLWTPTALEKSLAFEIEIDDGVPKWITSDPVRLRQILNNLISNAIKFTHTGEVSVSVSSCLQEGGQTQLSFRIKDTGCGIDAEDVGRLFSPFEQADRSTTRKFGGTGLGLTISRRFARKMGGDIVIESQPGSGSEFTVTITAKVTNAPILREAIHSDKTEAPCQSAIRLLVAEDHAVNRSVIEALLTGDEWEITFAENGVEAVERAGGETYDAILMDIQMPKMDGVDATRVIRTSDGPNRTTPIIATTANAMSDDQAQYLAAGMNDVVSKPFQPDRLRTVLRRARRQNGACR
jgi:two-component system, sensor histidine kinase